MACVPGGNIFSPGKRVFQFQYAIIQFYGTSVIKIYIRDIHYPATGSARGHYSYLTGTIF